MRVKHAFGDDLDACGRADAGIEPGAVADRLADCFAAKERHAVRCSARGEATWLEHDDPIGTQPIFVEQAWRNDGGLAGAWRCVDNNRAIGFQRAADLVE